MRKGALGLLILALPMGCMPAGLFDFEVSEGARRAEWPTLYAPGPEPQIKPKSDDPEGDLAQMADGLAARAAALRARAKALDARPVVPRDDRAWEGFGG